ncbi:MAG: flagellar export protein FliJ [Halioglobus sp.]|nr:flagellar export protein FliJ [Halioglobus sp.]
MKDDKMNKVAAVAKIEAHKSGQQFSDSQKSHSEKVAQLEQLVQFKADYERTLTAKGSEGMGARQFQDYRLFLTRLNEAIAQQTAELQGSEASLSAVREEWVSKTQRNQALDQLVEDRHKERVRAQEKNDQKRADDDSMSRGQGR